MNTISKVQILILVFTAILSCKTSTDVIRDFEMLTNRRELPLVTFLKDDIEGGSVQSFKEIKIALDYAKISSTTLQLSEFNSRGTVPKTSRALCINDSYNISDSAIDSLHTYVARGGTLFVMKARFDERLAYLVGLTPNYKLLASDRATGLRSENYLLPGSKTSTYMTQSKHLGIKREDFSNQVDILATAANNTDYPLVVVNKVGKGKVVTYNSNQDFEKNFRGLAFTQMLMALEGIPYPVANVANIHLDDFPSPVYDIFREPVKSNLGLTMSQFVTDQWWPDMQRLAEKHNTKYTVYPAFDYTYNISPPFTFNEWENNKFKVNGREKHVSDWLGSEVLKNGHEMGFHGYNHVSLTADEWPNPEYMVTALKSASKKWKTSGFGNYPISYVPPSNIIDSVGINKLQKGMPSLRYLQSTYFGDFQEGGDREFAPERYNHHFFDVPRISSGYFLTDESKFEISSVFLFTGIWTHFVHPDDVYQIPNSAITIFKGNYEFRNPNALPWRTNEKKKGLFEIFDEELSEFKQTYPMSRFLTSEKAGEMIIKWRYAHYQHIRKDGFYAVLSNDYDKGQYDGHFWFAYVSDENDALFETSISTEVSEYHKTKFLKGYLYQIKTDDAFLSIPDLAYENQGDEEQIANFILKERDGFYRTKFEMLPLLRQIEAHKLKGEYAEASKAIEDHIAARGEMTLSLWEEYAELMSWQQKLEDMWNILEGEYELDPSKDIAAIGLKLKEKYGFSNAIVEEKWTFRLIRWDLGGLPVLKEYLEFFNTEENRDRIKEVYLKIIDLAQNDADRSAFISFLINTKDPDAKKELETIEPCDAGFISKADDIAWYYADNFKYDLAYEWSKCCKTIDKATINEWFGKSNYFESLKEKDPYTYYGILIENSEKRAYGELKVIPDCKEELKPLARKIALLMGDFENYIAALSWSRCADSIPIKKLLTWNYETGNYSNTIKTYEGYIEKTEDAGKSDDVKSHMGDLSLYMGNFKYMAKVLASMAPGQEFVRLRSEFNKNVKYADLKTKKLLLFEYPELLSIKRTALIKEELRLVKGNDIFFRGNSVNDRFDPTQLDFVGGYAFRDKKDNLHELGAVRAFAFAINFIQNEPDNLERNLLGLDYTFEKQLDQEKTLSLGARIEGDNENNTFFHARGSFELVKDERFFSGQLKFAPVSTGPGYVRGIYRGMLSAYAEFDSEALLKPILTLESSYYTDDNLDATLNARLELELIADEKFKLLPLVESAYSISSTDQRDGFPYWTAENRLIGGGGLAMRIGKPESKFYIDASATYFFENQGEPTFERYLADLNFRIKKYFALGAGMEFYTIDRFFSNAFTLGIRYDIKSFK